MYKIKKLGCTGYPPSRIIRPFILYPMLKPDFTSRCSGKKLDFGYPELRAFGYSASQVSGKLCFRCFPNLNNLASICFLLIGKFRKENVNFDNVLLDLVGVVHPGPASLHPRLHPPPHCHQQAGHSHMGIKISDTMLIMDNIYQL